MYTLKCKVLRYYDFEHDIIDQTRPALLLVVEVWQELLPTATIVYR